MGYLDEDTGVRYKRVNRSLGVMNDNPEYIEQEELAENTEPVADDDFMTSEERRTACLESGLEAALDAIKEAGSDEAFNIAHNLYVILRTDKAKAILDKYL